MDIQFAKKKKKTIKIGGTFSASFFNLFFFQIDGWTTDDLVYKWKDDEPVQIVKDLNLPRFKLEEYSTDYCNTVTNTGMYCT